MMKNFSFKVLDRRSRLLFKTPFTIGQITINDFQEKFEMPLDWWSVENYEQQWKDGFEYLKNFGKSCFITKIFKPTDWQCVEWWVAHKIKTKIKIQNHAFMDKRIYKKICGNQLVTLDNWHNFIPDYTSPFLPVGYT